MDEVQVEAVERAIARRRSTRSFTEDPILEEEIGRIIDAGIAAPSGSNSQNQRFLVITGKAEIERIGRLRFVWPYKNADPEKARERRPAGILGNASALILVFADAGVTEGRNLGEYYIWESLEIQNCSASIENMLIMATAMGIGSCWVSASERMNHRRMLGGQSWRRVLADYDLEPTMKIQGIVLLGRPRHVDEEGLPAGEKRHGATVWRSIDRKPRDFYLIGKCSDADGAPLTALERLRLRALSRCIAGVLAILKRLDRMIWKLELNDQRNVQQRYSVQEGDD